MGRRGSVQIVSSFEDFQPMLFAILVSFMLNRFRAHVMPLDFIITAIIDERLATYTFYIITQYCHSFTAVAW
jgi:hypothetical protein